MHLWSWIAHPHVAFNPHFPGVLFSRDAHLVSRTVNDAAKTKRFTHLESDRYNMGRGNRERERIRRKEPCLALSSEMRTGYEEIFLLFLPTPIFGFQAGVLGLVGNGDSSFAIWGPSGVSRQTISKRTRWFAFSITGLFGKASGFPAFPRQE